MIPKLVIVALSICVAANALGTTVTLTPSADAAILAQSPDNNTGGNDQFSTGANSGAKPARGLIRFNLVGQVPANASIQSATLTLTCVSVPGTVVNSNFDLNRLLVDWGEGNNVSAGDS